MWISVSGANARAHEVDTVANNLANLDTLGYKKDLPAFKEYLSAVERTDQSTDIPKGPIRDRDLVPTEGMDGSHVAIDGTYTSFKSGNLKVTQNPLDFALDGPGFFEVSTPSGIRYTKQGSFKVATDGRLVTSEGYPVLASQPGGIASTQTTGTTAQPGPGGLSTQGRVVASAEQQAADIAARFINVRDQGSGQLSSSESGQLYLGDKPIAKLSVVEFQDVNGLRKVGSALFDNQKPGNAIDPQRTQLRQGVLESSNVNPVEEMSNLIRANRMFEHDLKVMKTFGDLMGREANDIGKL